jgi:hypothetical protein
MARRLAGCAGCDGTLAGRLTRREIAGVSLRHIQADQPQ